MKLKLVIFVLSIIFMIPVVTAVPGIFDILNKTEYRGSLDIITEYQDPDKIIQSKGHISGWIDIVGFEDIVTFKNTSYCKDISNPVPIIEYDIWDEGITSTEYINNDNVDFIKVTRSGTSLDGNNIVVDIDVHLMWHHSSIGRTKTGRTYVKKTYYNEYATFTDSMVLPLQYPGINDSAVSTIIYNNSFNPHVDIHVPVHEFETKTVYSYHDETITRISKVGYASTGYVNLSDCLQWEDESDMFAYRNEKAILLGINKTSFDPSDLEIITHTPYETVNRSNYYVSVEEFDETGGIGKKLLTSISVLIIFAVGIKKCFSGLGDLI